MDEEDFKDSKLKALLKDAKEEMPFSDFEERLMSKVKTNLANNKTIWRNIKLSWFFFIIGSIFGIVISLSIPMLDMSITENNMTILKYALLTVAIVIIMWQFEEMIKLSMRQKKKYV